MESTSAEGGWVFCEREPGAIPADVQATQDERLAELLDAGGSTDSDNLNPSR